MSVGIRSDICIDVCNGLIRLVFGSNLQRMNCFFSVFLSFSLPFPFCNFKSTFQLLPSEKIFFKICTQPSQHSSSLNTNHRIPPFIPLLSSLLSSSRRHSQIYDSTVSWGCSLTYYGSLAIFMCITVPMSLMELSEQATLQLIMTMYRLDVLILILSLFLSMNFSFLFSFYIF